MINAIINAVGDNIAATFEGTKIYKEIVKQGFETPCFCISPFNVENNLFRGERYKYLADIEIRYYHESVLKRMEIFDDLIRCLDYIKPEGIGLVRCVNLYFKIEKDYYSFRPIYEFYYVRKSEKDVMGSVEIEMNV